MGLDLELAIAEQLEENRLGQFDIRGGKPHHRRQSKSRQQVGSVESPGVRHRATGQQQPYVVLERHIDEVKKQRFRLRGPVCVLEQHRIRATAGLDALIVQGLPTERDRAGHASPDRSKMAFSRAFRPHEGQHSTPPLRPKLNRAQSLAVRWRGEKIFAREAWRVRPAKSQLARRRNHQRSGFERPR